MGECIVCASSTGEERDEYCASHLRSLGNMRKEFQNWSRAYGGIRLELYLSRLSELPETGERVKDLASFLTKNPGRWLD